MQWKGRRENLIMVLLFAVLFLLSVIGIWKTVYFSADIDESYALTMATRMVSGDCMLLDMWEPHQMSAALYAPLVALYKSITGSMEGALVFMRICGVVIQAGVSLFVYRVLKSYMPGWISMTLAFAYFNFTPKHIQSPEFSSLFYWAFMVLLLCLIRYSEKKELRYVIAAGVCQSVIVLCYPVSVLLFVYLILRFFVLEKGMKRKAATAFGITCMFCGFCFVVWMIVCGGSVSIFKNIPAILMDESHDQNLMMHMYTHLCGLWEMLRILLAFLVLCHVSRPLFKKNKGLLFGILLMGFTVMALVQFHGIKDVNFMIIFPVLLQLLVLEVYAYGFYEKSETDQMLFEIGFWPTLIMLFVILSSSNVLTRYSVSYVMPGVLVLSYQIFRIYGKKDKNDSDNRYAWMACVLLFCVVLQIFATRTMLVRFTSTQKKNIFQPYYKVSQGILKGISLGDFDYIQYDSKRSVFRRYVTREDTFLYVGADMFLYAELDGKQIATGNTISTPAFGEQLMHYYEMYPERIPTVVFVDREYGADFSSVLLEEPMKTFMDTYFGTNMPVVEPAVTVYTRER